MFFDITGIWRIFFAVIFQKLFSEQQREKNILSLFLLRKSFIIRIRIVKDFLSKKIMKYFYFKLLLRKKFLKYDHEKNSPYARYVKKRESQFLDSSSKNFSVNSKNKISVRNAYLAIYSFKKLPPC